MKNKGRTLTHTKAFLYTYYVYARCHATSKSRRIFLSWMWFFFIFYFFFPKKTIISHSTLNFVCPDFHFPNNSAVAVACCSCQNWEMRLKKNLFSYLFASSVYRTNIINMINNNIWMEGSALTKIPRDFDTGWFIRRLTPGEIWSNWLIKPLLIEHRTFGE